MGSDVSSLAAGTRGMGYTIRGEGYPQGWRQPQHTVNRVEQAPWPLLGLRENLLLIGTGADKLAARMYEGLPTEIFRVTPGSKDHDLFWQGQPEEVGGLYTNRKSSVVDFELLVVGEKHATKDPAVLARQREALKSAELAAIAVDDLSEKSVKEIAELLTEYRLASVTVCPRSGLGDDGGRAFYTALRTQYPPLKVLTFARFDTLDSIISACVVQAVDGFDQAYDMKGLADAYVSAVASLSGSLGTVTVQPWNDSEEQVDHYRSRLNTYVRFMRSQWDRRAFIRGPKFAKQLEELRSILTNVAKATGDNSLSPEANFERTFKSAFARVEQAYLNLPSIFC